MEPVFFETEGDFRRWLEKHHESATEIVVGFYKKSTGRPSMTWSASVDQALCFGWIDGVVKSIDDAAYQRRFTPRRPGSIWSAVNINKMEELLAAGLVYPMGKAAYEKRQAHKSRIYAYEKETITSFPAGWEAEFKEHEAAWEFFNAYPPGLKRTVTHWVTSAKQEKTRRERFEKLIEASKQNKRIR